VGTEGQVDEGAWQGGGEGCQQDGVGTVVEATGGKGCQQLPLMINSYGRQKNSFCVTYLINRMTIQKIPQKAGSRIRIRKRSVLIELLDTDPGIKIASVADPEDPNVFLASRIRIHLSETRIRIR
jgi:hypothetical protein